MTSCVAAAKVRISSAMKNGGAKANISASKSESADILRIENFSTFRHCIDTSTRKGAKIIINSIPKRPVLTAEMLAGEIA